MRFWIALLCLWLPCAVQADARPVQVKGSTVNFAIMQMGVTMQGEFKRFSGTVLLDPKNLNDAAIRMQVDVASISAGGDDTDSAAVQANWLDAATYPQAQFISSAVTALGGSHYQAVGTLTIKGVTHTVQVPFDWRESANGSAAVIGQFQFKRGDYKIGTGEWSSFDLIANAVLIKFHLVLGAAGTGLSSSQIRSVK